MLIDNVMKFLEEKLIEEYGEDVEVGNDEFIVTNDDNGCGVMIKLEFMT